MAPTRNGADPEAAELRRELAELSARVARIEQRLGGQAAPLPDLEKPARAAVEAGARAIPVLGGSLLGLAGAYLLRALTESGTLPLTTGVDLGIGYALLWLVWAARTPVGRNPETVLRSLTSVLVLSPLLWEATLRFRAISPWTAGMVLFCFTLFGMAISWRKNLRIVATIGTLAGLATAAGLLLATRDVVPFLLVLLAIAAVVEISACLEHWMGERWAAALAVDLAVLLAASLVMRTGGLPEGYAPIPLAWVLAALAALTAIYVSSTVVRTLARGFDFTVFEMAQCAAALLLSIGASVELGYRAGGVLALVLAAGAYAISLTQSRNRHTYATFAMLLALAGSYIVLGPAPAGMTWALLAIAGVWIGRHVQWHGVVFLLASALVVGVLQESTAVLLGGTAAPQGPGLGGALAGIAALVCYGLMLRGSAPPLLRLVTAATASWLAAGFLAAVAISFYGTQFTAGAGYTYSIRTAVLAMGAVALAWGGSQTGRAELSRLVYPFMLLGAFRLLALDLRQDQRLPQLLSLVFYGAALLALPRVIRKPLH